MEAEIRKLLKYGHHVDNCDMGGFNGQTIIDGVPQASTYKRGTIGKPGKPVPAVCTCGFDAALQAQPETQGEGLPGAEKLGGLMEQEIKRLAWSSERPEVEGWYYIDTLWSANRVSPPKLNEPLQVTREGDRWHIDGRGYWDQYKVIWMLGPLAPDAFQIATSREKQLLKEQRAFFQHTEIPYAEAQARAATWLAAAKLAISVVQRHRGGRKGLAVLENTLKAKAAEARGETT